MTERTELKKRNGIRFRSRAIVDQFGTKPGFRGRTKPTIMIKNVVKADTGEFLTDHLWFTCGKWSSNLKVGDIIEFDARVGDYIKGYKGRRYDDDLPPISRDWKFLRPTKVVVTKPEPETKS